MSELPWDRAKKKQSYQKQEQALAKDGGKKQINSGRTSWYSKRDVIRKGFLYEARTTTKGSLTIKVAELKKLTTDAYFHNALPGMPIDFETENEKWILTRRIDFNAIEADYARLITENDDLKKRIQELEFEVRTLESE